MAKREITSSNATNEIAAYGLSSEELESLRANLPSKDTGLFVAWDLDSLVMEFHGYAIVVNVEALGNSGSDFFFWFYEEVPHFPETVILVGDCACTKSIIPKFLRYPNFESLEPDLKYVLLGARKKKKAADNFSNSFANILKTLRLIAENPGISSKEIAEKLEVAPRSVTRYIETLNIAGESIVYDRKPNGWRLEYGESLLMMGV